MHRWSIGDAVIDPLDDKCSGEEAVGPLVTGVADIPPEGFVTMHRFQKVGEYARFRGEIKKCTDQKKCASSRCL
jgi:hypothetical protein